MYHKFEDKTSVKVIAVTQPVVDYIPTSQDIISYAARVSNPSNQENFKTSDSLLAYCAKNGHWSVFETCNMVLEIKAPRDISRQILRHRTASFQEYSQRYAEVTDDMFCLRDCRMQDAKNRQNSIACADEDTIDFWIKAQQEVLYVVNKQYYEALERGIAKEVARTLLPEGLTMSSMYMNATLRTWLHYANLRGGNGTQLEHIEIAKACKDAIKEYFPSLCSVLEG